MSYKFNKNSDNQNREISSGIIVYTMLDNKPAFLILYHGHKYWNFPKGKIEKEEKSFEAALRETKEETGLTKKDIKIIPGFLAKEHFTFLRNGKKIYKTVIFYLAKTDKRHIELSDEHLGFHLGFGWFSYKEAMALFPREKSKDTRKVLRQALNFLTSKSDNFKKV